MDGTVSAHATVPGRPEDVFAAVTDLERVPEWVLVTWRMLDVTPAPDGARVGTRYTERTLGLRTSWTVTRHNTSKDLFEEEHEGSVPLLRIRITLRVRPTGAGTRFEHAISWQARGGRVMRRLGRVLGRPIMHWMVRSNTRRVRRILPGGRVSRPGEGPRPRPSS